MKVLRQLRRLRGNSVTLEHVSVLQSLLARVFTAAALLCALLGFGPMSLAAMAAPGGAATLCTNSDARLAEASGLVATPSGYAVVNDGGDEVTVFLLDRECSISRILTSPQNPFDPEDLARTGDGTLWIADIGDNDRERETVVIWEVNPGTGAATRHRLAYPDGAHDAEALLMPLDKTPVIVTKESSGTAKVYVATRPLAPPSTAPVALRAAGTVTIAAAGTPGGPLDAGPAAGVLVTGGAVAPDGKHVALRTYTDAYEWELGDDNNTARAIAEALTSGDPTRTPLQGEPHGESIGYTLDNAGFVTLSEGVGQPLQQWKPARAAANSSEGSQSDDDSGWGFGVPDLNHTNLMSGIYATALLGGLLLVSGILGILRWRRRRPTTDSTAEPAEEDDVIGVSGPYVPPGPAPLLYPPGPVPRQITAGPGATVPPAGMGSRGTTYGSSFAASTSVPQVSAPPTTAPTAPRGKAGQGTVYGDSANAARPPAGAPTTPGNKRGTVYGGRNPTE